MDEKMLFAYKNLERKLSESNEIRFGSPDQFQYRQNQLLQCLSELILIPYQDYLKEKEQSDGT